METLANHRLTLDSVGSYFNNNVDGNKTMAAYVDLSLRIQNSTDKLAKLHGFICSQDFKGCTLYDSKTGFVDVAASFNKQFHRVIDKQKNLYTLTIYSIDNNEPVFLLTSKFPCYHSNNITGSLAIGRELNNTINKKLASNFLKSIIKDTGHFSNNKTQLRISLELIDKYDCLNLSIPESVCFYYTIHGFNNKETSAIIHRSPRTIESHLDKIRIKTGCNNKRDLINLAFSLNIIYLIPKTVIENYFYQITFPAYYSND